MATALILVCIGATAAMVLGTRRAFTAPLEDRRGMVFGLAVGGVGWFGWHGFVLADILRIQMGWTVPGWQRLVIASGLTLALLVLAWLAGRRPHGGEG